VQFAGGIGAAGDSIDPSAGKRRPPLDDKVVDDATDDKSVEGKVIAGKVVEVVEDSPYSQQKPTSNLLFEEASK